MSDVYVAARVMALAGGRRALPGEPVDVAAWPPAALAAALGVGEVRIRRGSAIYAPAPYATFCPLCSLPFASYGDVEQHGRHVHGWQGSRTATPPDPALVRVRYVLTHVEAAGLAAGRCPICPEPATPEHVAERHPEIEHAAAPPVAPPVVAMAPAPAPAAASAPPAAPAPPVEPPAAPDVLACPDCPGRIFRTPANLALHLQAHERARSKAAA